ncbi:hypothetical protein [Mucilaginibacter sp.]
MNNIFELKRFGLLLKKTVMERPVQLFGLCGLILAATLVLYSVLLHLIGWQGWNMVQNLTFVWCFMGGGCFLSSIVFGYFGTNASGSAYLTLPASTFEKWLCGVLIIGVCFPCLFLVFFRLMDASFVMAYHNGLDRNSQNYKVMYDAARAYPFDNVFVKESVMIYVNFVGAMMVGSLYFNKVSAIKTAIVYCCALAIIFFLNLFLAKAAFSNVDMAFPFNKIMIKVGNGFGTIELPSNVSNIVHVAILFIIPIVLWITAYIRLREKEI